MDEIAREIFDSHGIDIHQLNLESTLFGMSNMFNTMQDLIHDLMTPGQIQLLASVKPIEEWCPELFVYLIYNRFGHIAETYERLTNKQLTFDMFYYAGIDRSIKVDPNDFKLKELIYYKTIVSSHANEWFISDVLEQVIINYQIKYCSYEDCKEELFAYGNSLNLDFEQPSLMFNEYDYKGMKEKKLDLHKELIEFYYHSSRGLNSKNTYFRLE